MKVFQKFISFVLILAILISSTAFTSKEEKVYKMKQIGGLHYISVSVNDKSADLLIDTGCWKSYLDISQSKKYKFDYYLHDKKLVGIGGNANSWYLKNYEVKYKEDPVLTNFKGADLSKLHLNFLGTGVNFVGILGSDFFENRKVLIDYKTNELIIRE